MSENVVANAPAPELEQALALTQMLEAMLEDEFELLKAQKLDDFEALQVSKVELLRQAYVEQNPHAFVKDKPPVLRAGAVLAVPNHDDLLRQYARPRDGAFPDYNDRRNWVRYP